MKIILVGMMGSGKSALGRKLSKKLNISLFECDEIFEEKFNIKIKDYFKEFGETAFRKEESTILKELTSKDDFVISTGGGVVLNNLNREMIFNDEIISIYVKTKPEVIFDRIKNNKTRPLLLVENPEEEIKKILSSREEYYSLAKFTIENNKSIDQTIEEILKCIQ